jgi:hypothetical protein
MGSAMISFLVFKHVYRADDPLLLRGERRLVSTKRIFILPLRTPSALSTDIGSFPRRSCRHVA